MKTVLAMICLLSFSIVYATNGPPPTPSTVTNNTTSAGAGAQSDANSKSNSHANSDADSTATGVGIAHGGAATAAGGKSDATNSSNQTATTGAATATTGAATATNGPVASDSASNANGQQAITQTYEQVRQTPPVLLPTILVNDCGAGFNGGGAKPGGAGAFGFTWTTSKCYDFKGGNNWAAIGEYEAACHLWADVHRAAFKRQHYEPNCKAIADRLNSEAAAARHVVTLPEPKATLDPGYVTKPEVANMIDRAFKQSVSK